MIENLKDRQFISGLVMFVVLIFITLVPDLEALEETLLDNFEYVIGLVIGGATVTQVANGWYNRQGSRALTEGILEHTLSQRITFPYNGKTVVLDLPDEMEPHIVSAMISGLDILLKKAPAKPADDA